MRSLIFGLACMLATAPVHAMTWQELEAEIDSVEAGNEQNLSIIVRFSDIVQMLMTFHGAVRENPEASPLFCLTPGGSLQLNEIVSIVRAEARQQAVAGDALVQGLLLAGFRREYPCGE